MFNNAESVQRFRTEILDAAATSTPLRLRGGGSKDWYGQQLAGRVLDTRAHAGIVDYEPTELVITARCGTPLTDIEAVLAERRQMLAFEPPHFGPGATLGGMLASGLSGPRRATSGAVRDFVLGATIMDGAGEVLRFGGQVMKNVAGYDVARLMAGSLGTLGLILDVSLKVLPLPVRDVTLRYAMGEIMALARLNEWAGQPLPISASCWHDGVLTLRLSGAEAAVGAAIRHLGGEEVDDAAAFWAGVREQRHAFFADAGSVWRLSLPSAASALILKGQQLIEWGGALRWLKVADDSAHVNHGDAGAQPGESAAAAPLDSSAAGGDGTPHAHGGQLSAGPEAPAAALARAQAIRRSVAAAGGHATLFRGGDKRVGVFHPLAPGIARIHERLKFSFDPQGIFNPGRMY